MKTKENTNSQLSKNFLVDDRFLCFSLVLLIVGTPTVFYRSMFYTFYLPQLTLFWVVSVLIFLLLAQRKFLYGKTEKSPILITVTLGTFLGSLLIVSILSPQSWVSFTGLTARGAGAFSYTMCIIIFYSVFKLGERKPTDFLISAFIFTHAIVVLYALLQAFDLDPIDWGIETQQVGIQVFSTLGNANFSAGYVGITIPLVVWAAFGSDFSPVIKTISGSLLGGSTIALVNFGSTQGDLAALLSLLVVFHWAVRRPSSTRYQSALIALPIGVIVGIIPLFTSGYSVRLPLVIPIVTSLCAYFGTRLDKDKTFCASEKFLSKRQWKLLLIFSLTAGSLLAFLLRNQIINELKSGLEQRFAFWRVGFSIFGDHPIFGTGLETYLNYFTSNRTKEHGVNWEGVISDSAHSVPIGFLSNGGIVLFAAYLGIVSVIGYFGVQAIKLSRGPRQHFFLAVFTAWLAYHLQSMVSIDTTGLMYTQWVLGGILVAAGVSKNQEPMKIAEIQSTNRRKARSNSKNLLATPLLIVIFILLSFPLTSPFRANVLAFDSEGLYLSGDFGKSEEKINQAIDLVSRTPSYHQMLAIIYQNAGWNEDAFFEFERNAELQPGISESALWAAYSAFGLGRYDSAEEWFLKASEYNPYSSNVMLSVAGFYIDTGEKEKALDFLNVFENLRTPEPSYWARAKQMYAYLEEEEKAEHADTCSKNLDKCFN